MTTKSMLAAAGVVSALFLFVEIGSASAKSAARPAPNAPAATTAPAAVKNAPRQQAAAPAEVKKTPAELLAEECKTAGQALRDKLDGSFSVVVSSPFVVAGDMPAETLNRCLANSILASAEAMWSSYFKARPDKVITVLLFSDDKTYRTWARKLFNDTDVSHFGYYKPDSRTLVMNISTGSGTLVHELTHALIVYDFPGVPTWFNEGLASLHEQCQIGRDEIIGMENWRLPALQKAVKDKTLRPLKETVTRDDFYGPMQGINYAQARYLCLYMQRLGLLRKFYVSLHQQPAGADAGVKAIEAVFGKSIAEVEKDYVGWVKTLEFSPAH